MIPTTLALLLAAAPRLSPDVRPTHYALTINVHDLAAATFIGHETIDVTLAKPTRVVTLHARDLTFSQVTAAGQIALVALDADAQTATLNFQNALPAGKTTLNIDWTAPFNPQLRGLYKSRHGGRTFASTMFESADARGMFPCFDEPGFKATFRLTVVAPPNVAVISNTPGKRLLYASKTQQTMVFDETPPLPTYLLAFAVGPFQSIAVKMKTRNGPRDLAVWAPEGDERLGKFAQSIAARVIPWLENYFDQPYPFPKLDLVAIPDFEHGAMENAGAIFFRDTAILADEKAVTPDDLREIALVVTHEIAHQWFGDLVTMKWWDDLWLNESFATWMEFKAIDALEPTWHIRDDWESDRARAFDMDALAATHAIHHAIGDVAEAECDIDPVTYQKGASVLSMLETYLGDEAFRAGLRRYMAAHRFGSATETDLWTELERASGKPITAIAQSWVDQPGYPLVRAKAQTISQQRFFEGASPENSAAQTWRVPVCTSAECRLLETASLPALADGKVLNAHRAGFYRVQYDAAGFTALANAFKSLEPTERFALLQDESALVRAGLEPADRETLLIDAATGELETLPLEAVEEILSNWNRDLVADADLPAFARAVERVLGPTVASLGWRAKSGEPISQTRARESALVTLGALARPEALVRQAQERFDKLVRDPNALEPIEADAATAITAATGDAKRWETMRTLALAAKTPQEKSRYLDALPAFETPELVRRTIDFALSPEARKQDAGHLLAAELGSRHGRALTWAALRTRWTEITKKVPLFRRIRLVEETGALCSHAASAEIHDFFSQPSIYLTEMERPLRLAIERNEACVARKERETAAVRAWIAEEKK